MGILSTLAVFADLCTVYMTFTEKRKKPKDYQIRIKNSIVTLNIFKETHTYAQGLRECCRGLKDEPLDRGRLTAVNFAQKLRDLNDHFKPFTTHLSEYDQGYFDTKPLESTLISDYQRPLKKVFTSVKEIIKHIKRLEPNAQEIVKWNINWHEGIYKPEDDIKRLMNFVLQSEEPARQALLASNAAIIHSITILNGLAVKLL